MVWPPEQNSGGHSSALPWMEAISGGNVDFANLFEAESTGEPEAASDTFMTLSGDSLRHKTVKV